MGNLFARVLDSLSGVSEKRILLLGLDAGGKVTFIYLLFVYLIIIHLFYRLLSCIN